MIEELTKEEIQQQIRYVSHEIRNHLSICDMYSQIIKINMEKMNIENESISNAIKCVQKSIQIIGTNLLDLKSLNNNCAKILDFKNLVITAGELSKAYVEDKEISFEIFVKNTANIMTDENRFLSCLVNIIKNGIESIPTRGKIQIIGEIKENIGIIKISNNGKPIPKEKQKNIFEQGYTTKKTGCGLGLAICKNFLNSQNARIQLTKSTKDQTTFEIIIPVFEGN